MYRTFLAKIPEEAIYEQPPREKIDTVKAEFYALFDIELPVGYIELLDYSNGLSYDGHNIAGIYDTAFLIDHPRKKSMDIIRFNSSFRDMTDITEYILLGKSSIDLIVYDIEDGKYKILSNGTMECFGEYDTFLELLYAFFEVEQ